MKKLLAFLLCIALCVPLAACHTGKIPSILPSFGDWLNSSNYQTTTTRNPDGTITTTLTPPTTTEPAPTSIPSLVPTTTPVPTAPSATPTTKPTTVPTTVPITIPTTVTTTVPITVTTTKPTTVPTTQPTTKPTTTLTTQPTTVSTTKPTTVPTTTSTTQPSTSSSVHTPLPYTERYLYNLLTEQEKGWYRKIDAAARSLQDSVSLNVNLAENERFYIYFIYIFDNPEQFYLGSRVSYSSSGQLYMSYSDGTTNSYRGGAVENLTDTMRANIRSRKAAFDAEVERIISAIPADLSPVKKELLIYDRILIDMYYNTEAVWDQCAEPNWTAYGGIINKAGVCEAYAETFQTLCYAVGINCTGVVGTVDGGGHKWNAVELDGEWYAVDVTFDDPINGRPGVAQFHNYFNITSAQMEKTGHSTADSKYPGPNCTGTKYIYQNVK